MGAITVGFLAAVADLMGALSRGTGILLTVMIIYKLYEDIAREHMYDMSPMLRKFMGH
jgi:preprotein translocase subunit SecY